MSSFTFSKFFFSSAGDTLTGQGNTVFQSTTNHRFGKDPSSDFLYGNIAEIAIYTRILSSSERTELENYFNDAWALGITL